MCCGAEGSGGITGVAVGDEVWGIAGEAGVVAVAADVIEYEMRGGAVLAIGIAVWAR